MNIENEESVFRYRGNKIEYVGAKERKYLK
jgi:hypothetical protein